MAISNRTGCETEPLTVQRIEGAWKSTADTVLDRLMRLTAEMFDAPMALLVLNQGDRHAILSSFGCLNQETAALLEFSTFATRSLSELAIITDATLDPRFSGHPAVIGSCQVRFYAGAPILDRLGGVTGSILVFDVRPHDLRENWIRQLQDLAGCIAMRLEYQAVATAGQRGRNDRRDIGTTLGMTLGMIGVGPRMLWDIPADGLPIEVSQLWVKRFGVTPEAMIHQGWTSFVHPADLALTEHAWSHGDSALAAIDVEHRLRMANGEYHWFRTSAEPVRNAHDGAIVWHGMTEDIHERVLNHTALRESEERLGLALSAGKFGFWELDPVSQRLIASDSFAQTFGRHHGHEFSDFSAVRDATHPDDHARQRDAVGRTIATGERLEFEHRTIWPDRSIHWVRIIGRSVGGSDGMPLRMLGLSLEITAERQAEAARSRAEARAIHMAGHDALTGLANRHRFAEILAGLPPGRRIAILLIDIDYFKAVNDTFGHRAGDMVIRDTADRLQSRIRESDVASRYGGDGFAVLQSHIAHADDALVLADRIRAAFSEPFTVDGEPILLGVSIGIAVTVDETIKPPQLLQNADTALHRAKFAERGVSVMYRADMQTALHERQAIRLGLRGALERDEFRLVYEPLIDIASGRIIAFEALLRWHSPLLGVVAPANFIPIAEETGLIVAIGDSVLQQACRDAASWPDAIRVAVNLSPVQFGAGTLEAGVDAALSNSGLDPDRLELEITEGILLQDTNANLSLLRALRRRGVHLSLDDFGTGYSSLSYLRRFPVDKIKIDRSLINGLPDAGNGDLIVRAIVGLGHSLGITTVSEGIESAAQLALVRGFGCNQAQGHLLSTPLHAAQIPALLERRWLC